jgi:hypothetical protein
LVRPWWGNVFINPPGGLVAEFWKKFLGEDMKQAIWIGYSLEQMQTLQSAGGAMPSPAEFSICFPRRRIAFVENEAKRAERIAKLEAAGKRANRGSLPSHANYVVYLGHNPSKFVTEFSAFGAVVIR